MGYQVQIIIEKNGRKVQFAALEDIDVIEHIVDNNQATFKFHVEGQSNNTMGQGAKLVVLDKHKELQKVLNPEPVPSGTLPLVPLGDAASAPKPPSS